MMNERIKQLAEQATTITMDPFGEYVLEIDFDQEKFAELIVRECAVILERKQKEWCNAGINDHYFMGVQDGLDLSIGTIKEHFGVEK